MFFDTFGTLGFKNFIIKADQKIIEEILLETEKKMKKTDNKLTLIKIWFKKKIFQFCDSAKDLFYFIYSIFLENLLNISDFISLYMLEDPIQNIESDNYSSFHLYFYKNMFCASTENERIKHERLTKIQ